MPHRTMMPLALCFGIVLVLMPATVRAEFPLQNLETNLLSGAGSFSSPVGWEFLSTAPISVTKLGYFDAWNDGLSHSHELGLFDVETRDLLVSATIDEGATAAVEGAPVTIEGAAPDFVLGYFRYVAIPTVLLQAGRHYIVTGTPESGIDAFANFQNSPIETASEIHLVQQRRSSPNAGLIFPIRTDPLGFFVFGPTFQFTPVPEPSTLALAGIGVLALLAHRLRRRPLATPRRSCLARDVFNDQTKIAGSHPTIPRGLARLLRYHSS